MTGEGWIRVKSIFTAALEYTSEERAAFLMRPARG